MKSFVLGAFVLFFSVSAQVRTSLGDIFSFGSSLSATGLKNTSLVRNRVYLLADFATRDGFLFAFSAVVGSPDQALIVVYRPESSCARSDLKPTAVIQYRPSAPAGWRENVYLESFYKNGCIEIKQNDVVGLYFPSENPSVGHLFEGPKNTFDTSRKCHDDGSRISNTDVSAEELLTKTSFKVDVLPNIFLIELFYYTTTSSSSNSCESGHVIPSNRSMVIRPSTTTPSYKGIPGLQGMTGPKGPIGDTGDLGTAGKIGLQGPPGDTGSNGYTGPTGERGRKGAQGGVGPTGQQGQAGDKGQKGTKGIKGATGLVGEPGFPGRNYTLVIPNKGAVNDDVNYPYGPYDSYFNSERAIWALFIWMAILSIIALLTVILLLASGTMLSKL